MPLSSHKRKASPVESKHSAKKAKGDIDGAAGAITISDMLGGPPVQRTETSSDFKSFAVKGEKGKDISCQLWGEGKDYADSTLIFTHGAGGGLENPATRLFAEGFSMDVAVLCFQGTMNMDSRVKSFGAIVAHIQAENGDAVIALGGRSMGARAAVITASQHDEIKKLVLVSYPLTSPRGEDRDQILLDLSKEKEVFFVIGSYDSMCDLRKLDKVRKKMKAKSKLLIVEGADHGMSLGSGTGVKGKDKTRVSESLRKLSGRKAAQWLRHPQTFKDEERIGPSDVVAELGQNSLDRAQMAEVSGKMSKTEK